MDNKERIANVGKAKDAIGEIESDARAGNDVYGQLLALHNIMACVETAVKTCNKLLSNGPDLLRKENFGG